MSRHGVRARILLPFFSIVAIVLALFSPMSLPQASAKPALVTCVNLITEKERVSRTGECRIGREAQANWHKNPSDSARTTGANIKLISTCSEREDSPITYRIIRKKCARNQVLTFYSRSGILPSKPVIAEAVSYGHDSAALKLARDPAESLDAPVAYYTITSNKGGTQKFYSWGDLRIAITGLQALTTYTFTVSATTVDGTSEASIGSIPVTTSAYVQPKSNSSESVAAPAFTLSNNSETKVATIQIAGYTISSTGGAITSYALSGGTLPAGLTFSTSNGLITGTPTETKTATTYTITGTNAAGSASATFRLRVTGDLGDTGPGGGKIFYYSAAGFNCGPSYTATGSPNGDTCRYLEVAPRTWSASADPLKTWANASDYNYDVTGVTMQNSGWYTTAGIGLGYKDSVAIITNGRSMDSTTAAFSARAYAGGSKNDWYLGSPAELNLLCKWSRGVPADVTTECTGGALNSATYGASAAGIENNYYWASTQASGYPSYAFTQHFSTGSSSRQKFTSNYVRPIRAF